MFWRRKKDEFYEKVSRVYNKTSNHTVRDKSLPFEFYYYVSAFYDTVKFTIYSDRVEVCEIVYEKNKGWIIKDSMDKAYSRVLENYFSEFEMEGPITPEEKKIYDKSVKYLKEKGISLDE